MGGVIAGLIAHCGCPLRLYGAGDSREIRGLLQPLRHRGSPQWQDRWSRMGELSAGTHLLLCTDCPAGFDMLERDGEHYWLRRWDAFRLGGQVLYYWALLTREGTEDAGDL